MKTRAQILVNLREHTIIDGGGEEDDGVAAQLTHTGVVNKLRIIASWGGGWDHVSVSLVNRCPKWDEMCFVKDFFFHPDECVIQYHPSKSNYVNNHPYCLHLWRPQNADVPIPPKSYVG